MPHILSTKTFKKEEVEKILKMTAELEESYRKNALPQVLLGKIIACIFFEPSTRTRLSFETAVLRLGGQTLSTENALVNSSAYKGETIEDTIRMLSSYADAIVIRHKEAGAVSSGASVSTKPVINAGDGAHEHPTQGFLDLYTIQKQFKKLEGLKIAFVGDLLNSRTIHSLLPLLSHYEGNNYFFVSPKELTLPENIKTDLNAKNISFTETTNLESVLDNADVIYMTRVQKERFSDNSEYEKVKDLYILGEKHLEKMKESSVILHPLPRVNEIDISVDRDPRAKYFEQAENGIYTRMALLRYTLNI